MTIITCDQCGTVLMNEVQAQFFRYGIRVEMHNYACGSHELLSPHDAFYHGSADVGIGHRPLDFCSFHCLTQWVEAKTKTYVKTS